MEWVDKLIAKLEHWTSVIEAKTAALEAKRAALENPVQEIISTRENSPHWDFDRALEKFDPKRDILVTSEDYIKTFDHIYMEKLKSLGDKVIVFPGGYLINTAVVTAGYSYSIQN
jgi:hypothetical protein